MLETFLRRLSTSPGFGVDCWCTHVFGIVLCALCNRPKNHNQPKLRAVPDKHHKVRYTHRAHSVCTLYGPLRANQSSLARFSHVHADNIIPYASMGKYFECKFANTRNVGMCVLIDGTHVRQWEKKLVWFDAFCCYCILLSMTTEILCIIKHTYFLVAAVAVVGDGNASHLCRMLLARFHCSPHSVRNLLRPASDTQIFLDCI